MVAFNCYMSPWALVVEKASSTIRSSTEFVLVPTLRPTTRFRILIDWEMGLVECI